MKALLCSILLVACGPSFTAEEFSESGFNPSAVAGHSGEMAGAGATGLGATGVNSGGEAGLLGMGGSSGHVSVSDGGAGASTGGDSPMAGGPAVGQGGEIGAAGQGNSKPLASCITLGISNCARDCPENYSSDCHQVLICWSQNNSFDNCQNFTSLGISQAKSAVLNCGCQS